MMCSGGVWSGTDLDYFWASLRGTGLMSKWASRVLALTHKPRGEAAGSCPALEDTCSPRQSTARATHLKENTLGIGHLGLQSWRTRVQTGSSKSGDNTHNPSPGWNCSLDTRGSLVMRRARPPGASPAGACGRGASAQPWPAAVGRACCQHWRSQARWSQSALQLAAPPNHAPPSRCDWTAAAGWWTCGEQKLWSLRGGRSHGVSCHLLPQASAVFVLHAMTTNLREANTDRIMNEVTALKCSAEPWDEWILLYNQYCN